MMNEYVRIFEANETVKRNNLENIAQDILIHVTKFAFKQKASYGLHFLIRANNNSFRRWN